MIITSFMSYKCKSIKEIWDTLRMIYEVSPNIKWEEMNTHDEEDEWFIHKCFCKFKNVRNYIGMFITNEYLRVNNWNHKSDSILKSRD